MVRQLAAPGRRGERARTVIDALIRSGVTRHLRGLLEALPDGEERRILDKMLKDESKSTVSVEAPGATVAESVQEAEGSARVEAAGAEPPGAEQIDVDPTSVHESMGVKSASMPREIRENFGGESSSRRSNDDGLAEEDNPQSSRKEKPDIP
jgi:hypothetical protein